MTFESLGVVMLLLVAAYFLYDFDKLKAEKPKPKFTGTNVSQGFKNEIPAGYQIYLKSPNLAGITHRKGDAISFVQGVHHTLEFERDPSNPHDPSAIKIIGNSSAGRFHIGFIPAEDAEEIVGHSLFNYIKPRLNHLYLSDSGYIEIEYDVLLPRDVFKNLRSVYETPKN